MMGCGLLLGRRMHLNTHSRLNMLPGAGCLRNGPRLLTCGTLMGGWVLGMVVFLAGGLMVGGLGSVFF